MSRVIVDAGSCGLTATIEVEKLEGKRIRVTIASDCGMLAAMNADLSELDGRKGVFGRMANSVVYQSASRHIKHTACPVPSAILKAIEVAVGVAPPKDVTMLIKEK